MRNTVGWGVFTSFALHLFQLPIAGVLMLASILLEDVNEYATAGILGTFLLIGVSQLLYEVPAFLIALRKRRTALAQGIAIGAGITFLLNAACWGAVLGSLV